MPRPQLQSSLCPVPSALPTQQFTSSRTPQPKPGQRFYDGQSTVLGMALFLRGNIDSFFFRACLVSGAEMAMYICTYIDSCTLMAVQALMITRTHICIRTSNAVSSHTPACTRSAIYKHILTCTYIPTCTLIGVSTIIIIDREHTPAQGGGGYTHYKGGTDFHNLLI